MNYNIVPLTIPLPPFSREQGANNGSRRFVAPFTSHARDIHEGPMGNVVHLSFEPSIEKDIKSFMQEPLFDIHQGTERSQIIGALIAARIIFTDMVDHQLVSEHIIFSQSELDLYKQHFRKELKLKEKSIPLLRSYSYCLAECLSRPDPSDVKTSSSFSRKNEAEYDESAIRSSKESLDVVVLRLESECRHIKRILVAIGNFESLVFGDKSAIDETEYSIIDIIDKLTKFLESDPIYSIDH